MTNLIDVHAHFLPDGYRQAALDAGHTEPDGFSHLPEWSATGHVAMMDRMGIATSMLSISSPGVHFGDNAAAAALAREVNEDARRAVVDHPGRFGQFAALPAPTSSSRSRKSSTASSTCMSTGFRSSPTSAASTSETNATSRSSTT